MKQKLIILIALQTSGAVLMVSFSRTILIILHKSELFFYVVEKIAFAAVHESYC